MASSDSVDIQRPELRKGHGSTTSFHSRALAVSAAHRFATSPLSRTAHIPDDHAIASDASAISSAGGISPHNKDHSHHPHRSGFFSPKSPRSPNILPHYGATPHPTSPSGGSGKRKISSSSVASAAPVYTWLGGGGGTGDEPGVDVKSKRDEEAWSHLTGKTKITVVDYTSDPEGKNVRVEFEGDRLKEWLGSEHASRETEEGKPKPVRWIHVDGVNWEVVKTLTLEYGLHPLAVEDALRATNSPRSKMDFYNSHLYLQILVQHMHAKDEEILSEVAEELSSWHFSGENIRSHHAEDADAMPGGPGGRGAKRRQSIFSRLPEGVQGVFEPTIHPSRMISQSMSYEDSRRDAKNAHRLTVDELSAKYMVPIRRGIVCVFLTRDGTLITMTRKPIREVLHPVYARLEDEASLLRRSGDVSMLCQALLDVSVDLAIEISQAFESEILRLEASVLVDPSIETVRHLHVLSSQLIRLRRSLTPLLHLAYIIRDQDAQRSAAASAMTAGPRPGDKNHISRDSQWLAGMGTGNPTGGETHHGTSPIPMMFQMNNVTAPSRPNTPGAASTFGKRTSTGTSGLPSSANGTNGPASMAMGQGQGQGQGQMVPQGSMMTVGNSTGFFSPMTKVYIGDVLDHLEIIVSNMDQFVATCDHLTDYVFNVLSFQTNASTERLSIVTVVFLPLTFIASYFGMNFTDFPSLDNPDAYFWKIAAPCTVGFFVIFSWSYLTLFAQTLVRKIGRWRTLQHVKHRHQAVSGSREKRL